MPKPRYDADEDVSRHGAVGKENCEEMQRKYGWELIDVEDTPDDPILKVDCVFEGKTEFPPFYQEKE